MTDETPSVPQGLLDMMAMTQAALEVSRQHNPPLLPPCKELWAAEIIYNAMEAARAPIASTLAPDMRGDVVERMTAWLYEREGGVEFQLLPESVQHFWRDQGIAAIDAACPRHE